jgi:ATP-dependent Clp protease ATP-binding subunit ClpC
MTNYTPRAQRALELARNEAERRGHREAGVNHLAMALIELGQGAHWNAWQAMRVDIPRMEQMVVKELEKTESGGESQSIAYTPRLKRALALAGMTAKRLNHSWVGTEHFFLALIDPTLESSLAKLLASIGVDYKAAEGAILRELDPHYQSFTFRRVVAEMSLVVDPGSAPPEVIADILAQISLIYRKTGGSGITFRFEDLTVMEEAFA